MERIAIIRSEIKKLLEFISKRPLIKGLILVLISWLVLLVANITAMALAVFPWWEVVIGIFLFVAFTIIFSLAIHILMENLLK